MRLRRPAAPSYRSALLACVVGSSPEQSAELARHPLVRRCPPQHDDALVSAYGRLAAGTPEPGAARGRLLAHVVDVEQRPLDEAATLLALSPREAQALLDGARRDAGTARAGGRCRGWPLVSGLPTLTAAEQRAAAGHLELCRGCRDRRAAVERARREALAGAAAVTAVVGAGAGLAAGGGLAAAGSALAGKAAAVVIGTVGAAVVAGGSLAAVAQQAPADVSRAPAVHAPAEVAPAGTPSPADVEVGGCAAPCVVETSAPAAPEVAEPSSAPAVPVPVLQLPADSSVAPSAPAVPSLPAIPSLPAVSPLPSLLPLPSVGPLPVPTLP